MTKLLGRAHPHTPGPCSGWCPDAVERAVTDAAAAGFRRGMRNATNDAAPNRGEAHQFKRNEFGFLNLFSLFRERVDAEIRRASARGARRWTRRLVRLYEDAGLVRFDK